MRDRTYTYGRATVFNRTDDIELVYDYLFGAHTDNYVLVGVRLSPIYDLTQYGIVSESEIVFETDTPSGTSVVIETNFAADGVNWRGWEQVVSGQAIPGIVAGMNLSGALLQIRQTLKTTDPAVTPQLLSCSYMIVSRGGLNALPEDHVVIFDGIMDEPVITETAMRVTVVSKLDILGLGVPRRRYQRLCNWKFGSPECGVSLGTVTGTVSAISPDGLTLTLSGRTEAANYYKDGVLTIGSERQRVLFSNGATFVVDYPFVNAQVGNTYSLRRGCDKTFETCRDRFGNQSRYGGYLSVPSERFASRR